MALKSENPPTLEPAGAGLPLEELKLTQQRFHQTFDTNPLSYYERLFESEKDTMLSITNEIDEDQRATQVLIERIRGIEDSSRNWSLFMTLEHLHVCNMIFLEIIKKLVSGDTACLPTVLPENVKPNPHSDKKALFAFKQSADQFQSEITKIDNLTTEAAHPHPWLGPLNAAKWLALSAVHMKIHRQQIELIQRGLSV